MNSLAQPVRCAGREFDADGTLLHDGTVAWAYLLVRARAGTPLQRWPAVLQEAVACCAPASPALAVVFCSDPERARRSMPAQAPCVVQAVRQPPVGHPWAMLVTLLDAPPASSPTDGRAAFARDGNRLAFFAATRAHAGEEDDGYRACLQQAEDALRAGGCAFTDTVRMFTAQAHDADVEHAFAQFNRARVRFFDGRDFGRSATGGQAFPTYPANTGTLNGEPAVSLSGFAASGPAYRRHALQNPLQIAPTTYQQAGLTTAPPLFSRALALATSTRAQTFVSGNVAVIGRSVAHPGDAPAQARTVLANIAALAGAANLRAHRLAATGTGLAYLVVTLRDAGDHDAVRHLVEAAHPGVPALYVHGSQALDALRVEIEAVAVHELGAEQAA